MLAVRWRTVDWQGILPVSLLAFVGWCGLSILWTEYRWATLGGVAYLVGFAVLGVGIALTRDTIQIVRAAGDVFRLALGLSLALEILAGLLIDSPIPFLGILGNLDQLGPIQGVMGSRNQFALVCLIALITFAIEFLTRSVGRGLGIGSLVLGGVCAALSRSPIVAAVLLVVAVAALALWLVRRSPAPRRTPLQIGLLVGGLVVAAIAWFARGPIIAFFSANSELEYRLDLWGRLWVLINRDLILGTGWIGHWRIEMSPFRFLGRPGERDPSSAFNAYLDVWFQVGLIGIFIFCVLVLLTFTRSWLLAGRKRSIVYAWAPLVVLALAVTALAESSILVEWGWLLLVICTVKAAQDLSWRTAWRPPLVEDTGP